MKKQIVLMGFALLLLFGSCKKKESVTAGPITKMDSTRVVSTESSGFSAEQKGGTRKKVSPFRISSKPR